ncbi:hypothetical protein [Roseivivax isoporae]|uniref:Uncharacterized protein n=1 Tax=Roseivivax isoporae LMG 25204 TaxID=1449351 RepID=X7F9C8_9RHOB|nr:hypothetical protein [Roseivivax isoporae]ETX28679.1 hypothetical protein RISW2_05115 [Roseivivax isoporae LMG 25204]
MIELFFVACLGSAPAQCEERSLVYTDLTPMACMMGAQPELAKWVDTHPRYTIARWQCRWLQTADQDA